MEVNMEVTEENNFHETISCPFVYFVGNPPQFSPFFR